MANSVEIDLDEFGWRRLAAEARAQGVAPEEIARHAILYFLADVDSGRLARRVPAQWQAQDRGHRSSERS